MTWSTTIVNAKWITNDFGIEKYFKFSKRKKSHKMSSKVYFETKKKHQNTVIL